MAHNDIIDMWNKLLFLLSWGSLLVSCSTAKPTRPVEQYLEDDRFAAKTSFVRIPIDLSIPALEARVNEHLQGVLYEDDSFDDGDKMKVKAQKNGLIRLSATDTAVLYQVPLDLWIQYNVGIGKVAATAKVVLDFATTYAIGQQWELRTTSELVNFVWQEKPRLQLAGVRIPVESIANLIIRRSEQVIAQAIDDQIAENFKLEHYIAEAWQLLQQPFEVSEEYDVWLQVNPQQLAITPIRGDGRRIQASIIMSSEPGLMFGRQAVSSQPTKLPGFSYATNIPTHNKDFEIFLGATMNYEEAERITKASVQGQTYEQGKYAVKVEDVELYGQGNNLIVNLTLSGSYNGQVYLSGEPVFNARRNRIEIEDLEYTLNTKNVLLRSASWLAKGTLKRKVQDNMDYLLNYNLEDIQKQLQETLTDYELSPGVLLNGKLETLDLYNAYLTTNGIKVVVQINGALAVEMKDLQSNG